MPKTTSNQWWILLLQGILALAFGAIAITYVGATALVLLIWFAAFALIDGIANIFLAISYRYQTTHWWLGLLRGIVSTLLGILVFVWPQLTALIVLYFIAARAIVDGIFAIGFAVQWRKALKHEWLTIAGGSLAILFGLWMFFHPFIGGLAILWVIGIYAVVIGLVRIVQAVRMRITGDTSLAVPA